MDSDNPGLEEELGAGGWAEVHGTLAGVLAAGAEAAAAATLAARAGTDVEESALVPWAENLARGLADAQVGFRLQLPGDEEPLPRRVDALSAWVRGFLSGVGQAGDRLESAGDDAREALSDLAAIARGAAVTEEGSEAEEEAFAELVEYVRLVVQYLFEALNPPAAPARGKMSS